MSRNNQSGKGFSSTPKIQDSKKPCSRNTADHKFKEHQALTLINQGKLHEAELIYRELVAAGSGSHIAHGNLGALLKMRGETEDAILYYKNALKLKPNYPEAHNNLGIALKEQGDLTAAIDSFNTAIKLKPDHPDAHCKLGIALQDKGNLTAAIAFYNKALQLNPNYPEAYNNLGNALKVKGELDEALINHKKALELDPEDSSSLYGIGRVQAVKGNLKDSKNSFHKAVSLDPNNTSALFELSKSIEDSKALGRKLESVDRAVLNRRDESMLEFALANFHHKSKNYANANQHLAKANKLKLFFQPSDLSEQLLQTKQITALAQQTGVGKPSDGRGKIFIVGAPRCGSTLLESVLSTDSNIRDLGESNAMSQAFAQIIGGMSAKDINIFLSDVYAEKTTEILSKHTHSVDKNLYNFRFTEAIARAMPSARIIHCRRHPLDNILSMLRSNLHAGNNYTADPIDAAKFLIHQEETMSRFKSKYEKHIFTFDYDAFVSNPEKVLSPLIDWLDLKWSETYLHPESNNRLINTASVIQARQPINSKSVGGWKKYRELLKPAEVALVESGIFNI